jgi:hypothetical protein
VKIGIEITKVEVRSNTSGEETYKWRSVMVELESDEKSPSSRRRWFDRNDIHSVHLSNICVVYGVAGATGRGRTVLLSRTKNGGNSSIAVHIIIFKNIRVKTMGNAKSTYHVESPKPKHQTLICAPSYKY